MQLMELAIPVAVLLPEFMESEVLVGARVCSTDGEARESDAGSTFIGPGIDEFNSLCSNKGTSNTSESSTWIKKANTESCRRSGLLSKLATEDVPRGLDHGTTSCSVALMSASEGKQTQWKIGKVQRNGTGSFKKLRMLQTENSLSQAEADDTAVESDKLGMHLVKCSNADKSAAIKQKSNINGKRGDRRNYRVQMKANYDSFPLKAGLPNFNLAGGGSNAFGIYGLKPDIHDVTKFTNDILLDELLGGSYKYPTQGKDKEKEAANVNEIILDSVRKACSVLRLRGLQQGRQTDELDNHVNKKISLLSPSRTSAANASDGDASSLNALSKCGNDLESCIKAESLADMHNNPSFQPKDVLERLALPSPKDLDSLLQDALKPAASGKLTDSRSSKSLSPGVTLPPFSWSNTFNGHYKSNNDATKILNKTTCHGRWVRIRSTSTFIGGGGYESYTDLESFTYDDSLVPAGHIKYKLPEIEKASLVFASQDCCRQNISSAACSTTSPLPHALHSPTVVTAAQTLCDIASHWIKYNSNGIMKWPKHPSQKAMKARKSRSNDKTEDNFPTAKSGTILDDVIRGGVESRSSLKKPKISVVEKKEDFSHAQAIIGLSSVSASKSSWSSPNRLSRDSIAESRHCNNSFTKPSLLSPLPPRVQDRSNHNPHKLRKVGPTDWNRTRS